mgnify:CR=1 FL=1
MVYKVPKNRNRNLFLSGSLHLFLSLSVSFPVSISLLFFSSRPVPYLVTIFLAETDKKKRKEKKTLKWQKKRILVVITK